MKDLKVFLESSVVVVVFFFFMLAFKWTNMFILEESFSNGK